MTYDIGAIAPGQYQPIIKDSRFFEDFDPQYLTRATRGSVDRLKALEADMREQGGKTGLDIGCNIGFFCHSLQAKGFYMDGIDSDGHGQAWNLPDMIDTARKLSAIYGLEPIFLKGSYLDLLGGKRKKWDHVLFLSTFHHIFRYAVREGKEPNTFARDVLTGVHKLARKTLYLEMSLAFPEVKLAGWTNENLPAILEEMFHVKPRAIHSSPDAHLEPRIIYAIPAK